jgi:hypothetical protein
MVTHMKTTVEIADSLLAAARRRARARGVTLRTLIEEGLRRVLREEAAAGSFRLRRASFKGTGRASDTREWDAVRALIYRENSP